MSFKKVFSILVLLFLIISCTVLFILQSLYFIFRTAASTEKELIKSVDGSPLTIPALVICNRMPFSQDGVNSVNANLRQDPAMRLGLVKHYVSCAQTNCRKERSGKRSRPCG
ncbi:hypothetical protein Y032_0170g276 [Ancylostoma ceylanicum]|uniref:Uncharacterized protein n=1 Tax=Ancylostoma ceylanicum TaxID=53326 RepID=A0A016SW16_9BILA|nr:hypothetical protein Y032_0170g276 [Ancylostoma ceylanicum]